MASSLTSLSVEALDKAVAMADRLTTDYSLRSIQRSVLSKADDEAKTDPNLANLTTSFRRILSKKAGPDDVVTSSQAFETYGEIKVYRHLKHHGLKPQCVPTVPNQGRPDFKCMTPDGKDFYVEVKSFDIVEGEFAQTAMLNDGLEASVDIESQQRRGQNVASSIQVIAPYGSMAHGECQLERVINTIEKKVRGNFKTSQFKQGPTFAVAILDKLDVPGRQCALSPYYHQDIYDGSACLSGSLWASAYAQRGYLLLDYYDFEGKPTNFGQWDREGYFSKAHAHPAQGIVFFDQSISNPLVYGLTNSHCQNFENWDENDTQHVLSIICDAWNCESNAFGYSLADYDSRLDFPQGKPSKSAWDV